MQSNSSKDDRSIFRKEQVGRPVHCTGDSAGAMPGSMVALCLAEHEEHWKPIGNACCLDFNSLSTLSGMFPLKKIFHLAQENRTFRGGVWRGLPFTSVTTRLGSFLSQDNVIRDFKQWEGSLTVGSLPYTG